MPRVTITKQAPPGPFVTLQPAANSLDLTQLAADVTNKEQFVPSGDDLVIAHNSGASPYTITFTSAADPDTKRTGDITAYSIGAGELAIFRFKSQKGWMQTDGRVYLEASNVAVKWSVLQLACPPCQRVR